MHDIEYRSFRVSFVTHAVCLLTLALATPKTHSIAVKPIALSFEQSESDGSELLEEPLVEWHADVSDSTAQQDSPAYDVCEASFDEALKQAPLAELDLLITEAPAFFETQPAEEIPGALVLLADTSHFLAQQRAAHGSAVGEDRDRDAATSFFGIRDSGDSVAYVVDCSSSMAGPPLDRLKKELVSSIAKLSHDKTFTVIFFNDEAIPMNTQPRFLRASEANKQTALNWIQEIPATGNTNPSTALNMALQMKPSVVFLMTDGNFSFPFSDETMGMLKNKDQSQSRINTVAFGQQAAARHLHAIAQLTNGHFASVKP